MKKIKQFYYKQIDIMTRKEEIDRAWGGYKVRSTHRYDEISFKEGAKWADKTMIDKICKLLKDSEYSDDDDVISKFNEDYIENVIRKYLEE